MITGDSVRILEAAFGAPGVGEEFAVSRRVEGEISLPGDVDASARLRRFTARERVVLFVRLADRALRKLELAALKNDVGRRRRSFWEYGRFVAGKGSLKEFPMAVIWEGGIHGAMR